jgi:hypothetical protein
MVDPQRKGKGRRGTAALLAALLLALAAPLLPGSAPAAEEFTGIRGRAALGGVVGPGVRVLAFRDFAAGLRSVPAAVSEPTGADGTYSLPLPPGNWFVVAARSAAKELSGIAEGDLFCFYGGNPVRVSPGRATNVGFNLVALGRDPAPDPAYPLSGVVIDEEGKPLPGAVVYVYRDPADGFKGMPLFFTRTGADGAFRARAGKGTFFVVVRKRESGELFGPTSIGDRFGYYHGNPVTLAAGETRGIRIDAVRRLGMLEKFDGREPAPQGIAVRARVTDREGKAVAGVRLLAYRDAEMAGHPAYVSGQSAPDGTVELLVLDEGEYWFLAREKLGGPAESEWYARYGGTAGTAVRVGKGGADLAITVERR